MQQRTFRADGETACCGLKGWLIPQLPIGNGWLGHLDNVILELVIQLTDCRTKVIVSKKPAKIDDSLSNMAWPDGPAVDRVTALRRSVAEADELFRSAVDAEQQRTAMLVALKAVLEFNWSLVPSIRSASLTRLFEDLSDLYVAQPPTLKRSPGHALTRSVDQRTNDAMIAAAFKILTEGGTSKGNMSREEAGTFIARELNRRGMKDRGQKYTKERVKNVYLDTVKAPKSDWPQPVSRVEAAVGVYRSRIQAIPHILYTEIMRPIEVLRSKDADMLRTIDARKRIAIRLIEAANNVTRSFDDRA